MNKILDEFFEKKREFFYNSNLQEIKYKLPIDEIIQYIREIDNTPIIDFFSWIETHPFFSLTASDIPQLSCFEDAFYNVVFLLENNGDKGFRYVEIGRMLQNDGIKRKELADRKYGENHAKAAEYLGYLYSIKFHYYVSCFGYILNYLNEEERKKLYIRLLIRTNLFRCIYLYSKNNVIELRKIFDVISYKTYIRRKSSVKIVLTSLTSSDEFDFNRIMSKIVY